MEETINNIIDMIVSTACPPAQPAPSLGPLLLHNPPLFTFCLAESQHGAVGECSPVSCAHPLQPTPGTWGLGGSALPSLGAPPELSTELALPLTLFSPSLGQCCSFECQVSQAFEASIPSPVPPRCASVAWSNP